MSGDLTPAELDRLQKALDDSARADRLASAFEEAQRARDEIKQREK